MQTLEHSHKQAAELYTLAYLLTGERAASLDVTLETIDDNANSFFSSWMLAWSRRVVIAKALVAIRGELAASARRMASKRAKRAAVPPPNWTLDGDTTKAQIERALLAIDVFPRCALLLSVFEGVSLDDAAILMDSTPDTVLQAQIIGLQELTVNLGRIQGWTSTASEEYVITSEMQHA